MINLVTEHRFCRDSAGRVLRRREFRDSFLDPYRNVFGGVRLVVRVKQLKAGTEPDRDLEPYDGGNLSFFDIPHYRGPAEFALRSAPVMAALSRAARLEGVFILRLPGLLGTSLARFLRRKRRPFAVELVGDPHDVFGAAGVGGALSGFYRRFFVDSTKRACEQACAVSYVTERTLQARYPAGADAFTASYSSVRITESDLASGPRPARRDFTVTPFTILSAGSLEQLYKGPDVLIDALARLRRREIPCRVRLAGDGRFRAELEDRARRKGIAGEIAFLGTLSREALFNEFDRCDLYVQPSRTEGLPRAVIEAMSRATPCAGTDTGGIPELIEKEQLIPVDDADALADLIARLIAGPAELEAMSAHSLATANRYRADRIEQRRRAFYRFVQEQEKAEP